MGQKQESEIRDSANHSERSMAEQEQADIEKPPVVKSWKMWYISLLIYLAALIALFTLFTKTFE